MKKLFLAFFLFTMPIQASSTKQLVVLNVKNADFYIVEYSDDLTQITIKPLPTKTRIPLTCAEFKNVPLNSVDFSLAPTCLMQSLNRAFKLNITQYIDLKNVYTLDELKQMGNELSISRLMDLAKGIKTNVSLFDAGKIYQNYKKLDELVFSQAYPVLLKTENEYIPLSGFMNYEPQKAAQK